MASDGVRKSIGKIGEDIACRFLTRKGYKIVGRNYRRKWGEIDIIAEKNGTVRFIEVKAATVPDGGISREKFSREMHRQPEELVHETKLLKLARTAALYMEERNDGREYQIDAVAVVMDIATRTASCRLYEQAIEDNL